MIIDVTGKRLTSMEDIERFAIKQSLMYNNNCIEKTAKNLGIGRATVYRKLKKYGIKIKLSNKETEGYKSENNKKIR